MTAAGAWRDSREKGWTGDIGYAIQSTIQAHRCAYGLKGAKPLDPGWNECSCGWEGYWSSFEPHVADHIRAVVKARENGPDA